MLICLSAWKKSGKDSAADHLIKNMGFKRVSFADPLKDLVSELYGVDRASLDDQSRKELPLLNYPATPTDNFTKTIHDLMKTEFKMVDGQPYWTPRALCILEGSTKRSADSAFWVKQALNKISPGDLSVIADMRYKSEAGQILEWGEKVGEKVVLVRINRFEESPSTDPSERDLDDYPGFHYVINNKGTLEGFLAEIQNIAESNLR